MAHIDRHPDVDDYIVEMTLAEITERGRGITDLFESGKLVIVKDYRLPFDFASMEALEGRVDGVADVKLRRRLKKLEATHFFTGAPPVEVAVPGGGSTLRFDTPVRQAIFDILCRGDRAVYDNAAASLKKAHDELERIFSLCFPRYRPTKLISSLRLTETLFENMHWDNHSIDDDFHQARIFCNLDRRKRVWNVSHRFVDYAETIYREHDLARFAGRDPNELINYIAGDVLGGTRRTWQDTLPRHRVAFEPGEVWLGESRMISHQIYYGERAMVYMWFVDLLSMDDPEKRFNARVSALHERLAETAPVLADAMLPGGV